MNILFYLRKARAKGKEKSTIYCRITIDSIRSSFSTNIKINQKSWDSKKGRIKKDNLNNYLLDEIQQRIQAIYLDFLSKKREFSSETIKNEYLGFSRDSITVLEIFDKYISYQESLKETDEKLSESTLKKWKSNKATLSNFLKHKKKTKILGSEFSLKVAEQYREYLVDQIGCTSSYHIKRKIDSVKQVLNYAVNVELIEKNLIKDFKHKKAQKKELVFVEEHELKKLEGCNFKSEKIQRVLDLFLFQCFTGLSYIDLYSFHIKEVGERKFIAGKRHKTNLPYLTPLLSKPEQILAKYEGALPNLCNQKYNLYLKVIQDHLMLKKNLTTHIARKTFAVMALNVWSIPLETVSKMLGHSSTRTTQEYYIDVLDEKVDRDTKVLEGL